MATLTQAMKNTATAAAGSSQLMRDMPAATSGLIPV